MRVRKSSCVKVFTSFEMQILYPLMGNMFSMPRYLTIEISQNYILQVNFIEYISLYISCASIYYSINFPPQLVFFLLLGFFLLLRLPQQSDQPSHAPGVRIFRLILGQGQHLAMFSLCKPHMSVTDICINPDDQYLYQCSYHRLWQYYHLYLYYFPHYHKCNISIAQEGRPPSGGGRKMAAEKKEDSTDEK